MVRRHTSRLVVWVAMDGFPNTMILAAEGQLCVPPGSSVGGDADTEPHVSQQLYVDVTPTHLKLVLMVIGFLPTRLLSLLRQMVGFAPHIRVLASPSTPQSHIIYPTMTPTTSAAASTSPLRCEEVGKWCLDRPCSPSRPGVHRRPTATTSMVFPCVVPLTLLPSPHSRAVVVSSIPQSGKLKTSQQRLVRDLRGITGAR